jgi:hypothetical protein
MCSTLSAAINIQFQTTHISRIVSKFSCKQAKQKKADKRVPGAAETCQLYFLFVTARGVALFSEA